MADERYTHPDLYTLHLTENREALRELQKCLRLTSRDHPTTIVLVPLLRALARALEMEGMTLAEAIMSAKLITVVAAHESDPDFKEDRLRIASILRQVTGE